MSTSEEANVSLCDQTSLATETSASEAIQLCTVQSTSVSTVTDFTQFFDNLEMRVFLRNTNASVLFPVLSFSQGEE
jgi:hypothetical protein